MNTMQTYEVTQYSRYAALVPVPRITPMRALVSPYARASRVPTVSFTCTRKNKQYVRPVS